MTPLELQPGQGQKIFELKGTVLRGAHLHLTGNIHSQEHRMLGSSRIFTLQNTHIHQGCSGDTSHGQTASQPSALGSEAVSSGVGQVTSQPCQSQGTALAASPCAEFQNMTKPGTEAGSGQPERPQQVHESISITQRKKNYKNDQKIYKNKTLCSCSSLQSLRFVSAQLCSDTQSLFRHDFFLVPFQSSTEMAFTCREN